MRRLNVVTLITLLAICLVIYVYADDIIDAAGSWLEKPVAAETVAPNEAPAPPPANAQVPPKPDKPSVDKPEPETKPPAGEKKPAQIGEPLLLVNKQYYLPADYVPPDLTKPDIPFSFSGDLPQRYMRKEAADALSRLYQQAVAEKITLVGVSGFRSYQTQKAIFDQKAKAEGEEKANQFSARPGESEHQTGLAIDISSPSVGNQLTQSFGQTKEGLWLAENAPKYGFIIRYLKGKEDITGYMYEPWHIRYVGIETAQAIASQNITLEEYLKK